VVIERRGLGRASVRFRPEADPRPPVDASDPDQVARCGSFEIAHEIHPTGRAWVVLFPKTNTGALVIANAADDMGADQATHAVVGALLPSLSPAK
jgi:hypothetical protein